MPAGTELWRVHRTDSRYPANSFNSTGIAPLTDAVAFDIRKHRGLPRQGRFDPVHDNTVCPGGSGLGGYLYVGLSVGAVVAEGILRGTDIPKSKLLSYAAVADFSLTKLTLGENISVITLDTQVGLAAINQDGSLPRVHVARLPGFACNLHGHLSGDSGCFGCPLPLPTRQGRTCCHARRPPSRCPWT